MESQQVDVCRWCERLPNEKHQIVVDYPAPDTAPPWGTHRQSSTYCKTECALLDLNRIAHMQRGHGLQIHEMLGHLHPRSAPTFPSWNVSQDAGRP